MLKSHIVEQTLYRSPLCIGAAWYNIPITVRMRRGVADDHLAKRPMPCLRSAASISDEAGDKQLFEVGGGHLHRLIVVGSLANSRSRANLMN
jgi:hypothetical protein